MIKPGDILISYPYLEDPYFFRSVICMMDHNKEGSFGLMINKRMPHMVSEVLPLFAGLSCPLFVGGPVDTQNLFFLHPFRDLKDAIKVTNDLYWNGDIHELKDMFELEFADESQVRFYLGYSGWGEGQLADEINEKSWLIADYDSSLLFHQDEDDIIWRKSIETLGDEYKNIAHYPVDPHMN